MGVGAGAMNRGRGEKEGESHREPEKNRSSISTGYIVLSVQDLRVLSGEC